MKAVAINVAGKAWEIDGGYESLKEVVGGWLEVAPCPGAPFVMFCDEEGKVKDRPFNQRANDLANRYRSWDDPLAGDVVLVGLPDRVGDNTEFTLDDLAGLGR